MNDTQSIQLYVGENIKKIRLARGLSLEDVAARIYKSKSTVSKYERGSIAIDIATLEDIAEVLDVHPAQLLMTPSQEKRVPLTQLSLDEVYMFSYDGKEKRIIKSVIERYQTDESNRFSIHLYYDVQSKNELGDCVSFYQGFSTKYDVLENYTLENSRHPIEQIWKEKNPENFYYSGYMAPEFASEYYDEFKNYVISEKSMISAKKDRPLLMEALVDNKDMTYECIEKAEFFSQAIRDAFDDSAWPEKTSWEAAIDSSKADEKAA